MLLAAIWQEDPDGRSLRSRSTLFRSASRSGKPGKRSRKRLSRRQRFAGREAGSLGTDLGETAFYISIIEQMFVLFLSFFARKIRTAWPVFAASQAVRFISS